MIMLLLSIGPHLTGKFEGFDAFGREERSESRYACRGLAAFGA
jgi:hypothetical protein